MRLSKIAWAVTVSGIVLVAVRSAHRKASFDAWREIMEALKSTAPFWKKETLDDQNGERWVHRNTPGS